MSKHYVIRWRSKVNGRIGQGSRAFERKEAEHLISELNDEYPEIEHELVEATETRQLEASGRGSSEGDNAANEEREKEQRAQEHAFTE